MALAPRIWIEEPVKSVTTWAAITFARIAGPDAFRRIARPFLGAAA